MADAKVCKDVQDALRTRGRKVTAANDAGLREALGLEQYSVTTFKHAVGSLVKRRHVIRRKAQQSGLSERAPITLQLIK